MLKSTEEKKGNEFGFSVENGTGNFCPTDLSGLPLEVVLNISVGPK